MLIDSLRAFGGVLDNCPIWVFETNPQRAPCQDLTGNGVQVIPLNVPSIVRDFIFADDIVSGYLLLAGFSGFLGQTSMSLFANLSGRGGPAGRRAGCR